MTHIHRPTKCSLLLLLLLL